MAHFLNPNDPPQPSAGVYEWHFHTGKERVSLYIGQAGRKPSPTPASTLFRGIQQVMQKTFYSDGAGKRLDTDFIVGCAIRYVEKVLGHVCTWEHISNDPNQEKALCIARRPLIQTQRAVLHTDLKCCSGEVEWHLPKGTDLEQMRNVRLRAEDAVFGLLAKYLELR